MKIRWRQDETCRRWQHTLADGGPAALRGDQAGQRHLEECDECYAILEALTALDAGFEAMAPMDAPDELVEGLLERVSAAPLEGDAEPATQRKASWIDAVTHGTRALFGPGRPRLKAAVAFALLVAISPFFFLPLMSVAPDEPDTYLGVMVTPPEAHAGAGERAATGPALASAGDDRLNLPSAGSVYEELRRSEPPREELEALEFAAEYTGQLQQTDKLGPPVVEVTVTPDLRSITGSVTTTYKGSEHPEMPRAEMRKHDRVILGPDVPRTAPEDAKDSLVMAGRFHYENDTDGDVSIGSVRADIGDDEQRARLMERWRAEMGPVPQGLQDAERPAEGDERKSKAETTPEDSRGWEGTFVESVEPLEEQIVVTSEAPAIDSARAPVADPAPEPAIDPERQLARHFLAERDDAGVTGPPATGYWTNTYVPGDPVLRYLQSRLAGRDRSLLATVEGAGTPRLHDGARRTTQPFDPPPDAALAIQLQSDRAAALGETRMLVQVGLAGTPRRGGRRPAMNVALVLDLSGTIPATTGAGLIGLAGAFAEAGDLGDRFRLIAAGPRGGELVAPEQFRHGPVTVATRGAVMGHYAAAGPSTAGPAVGLVEALRLAIEGVAAGDDPSAPLGSSAIVLATSRPLGAAAVALAELAHDSAVAGIPVSVVGVGDAVDVGELDQLALAGQGSRRLLRDPSEAPGLVDRELAAAGRAVARAVRLRIQLAPGVRLFDVVGSRRLDEAGAERVRQTERAIDQRLALNLGLTADRGDDEAGIQIVIPTFYAGDRHAILLDVVVPGPGPVADVTVRFKDLVRLENAVARARLDVPRGEGGRGPLELNVLKNLLAHRLREVLEEAADEVALGGPGNAAEYLADHRRLLAGLRLEVSGLDRDPDLDRDVAMLDEYVRVLGEQGLETPGRREYLTDSLRYAGLLKVLPAPVPVGGTR